MEYREVPYGSEDYRKMAHLRNIVLRRPMGRVQLPSELAKDVNFRHVAAFDGGQVRATAMLDIQGDSVRIRQVSVHPDERGKGIGAGIMAFAEEVAKAAGVNLSSLHARETALAFYERIGYVAEGDYFEESGLPHIRMTKRL
ncbi:MAG: GNAT family N-acetyltransferase [Alphaproteobacteria bacterium]|nr:GNAT family N-acetyltransferase [Alphaproteobacteria bacterium]